MEHDRPQDGPPAQVAGYAYLPPDSPAYWQSGTYWRLLSSAEQTVGRSCTFDELCPPGLVAPPHVHDAEEEAFFVLEGNLVFTLEDKEIQARPGTYVYIPPGTWHSFRCDSEVGRVYNVLAPGGFDHGITSRGTPAPAIDMPPPGTSSLAVWRQLDSQRPRSPWELNPQWSEKNRFSGAQRTDTDPGRQHS